MAEVYEGYVERIIYRNVENGYTVLEVTNEDEDITCVGTFPFINEGDYLLVTGSVTSHRIYGEQLKVESYELKEPEDLASMEMYLSSGAIKGIGAGLAKRIIKLFKEDTFRIMEEEPERLAEVKGISIKMAQKIAVSFDEKKELREAMVYLQQYGISNNLAVKIYNTYKERMFEVLKKNPYQLADDISGVGFKIADEIGKRVGILEDSDFRIKAGILYVLLQSGNLGHVYLPQNLLIQKAVEILSVTPDAIQNSLTDMQFDKRIVMMENENGNIIYSSNLYYMELNCARMLLDLNVKFTVDDEECEKRIIKLEKDDGISLDFLQKTAIIEGVKNGILVITGGPGTGKTTTINTLIKFLEGEGLEILLAAPTGRAAKRMSETTAHEAQTIHRLLELTGNIEEESHGTHFERNETNPLEADVIIIDEMSMVDIYLLYALLKAITIGTRVIFVGDVNQLPSVGPGNVLRDIIMSHSFNVVKLTRIFRQAAESDIIVNAHKINDGDQITIDNNSKDFFFLQRNDSNVVIQSVIYLVQSKLPGYVNADSFDIQVLTPMKKGELGVERLNQVLQQYLNPPSGEKNQIEIHQSIFREGDKVMQIKNNYNIKWEIKGYHGVLIEEGMGVFNGDSGRIVEINTYSCEIKVEYEEGKLVTYPMGNIDELELAYAVTIHKSQGSEYPAVVLPLLAGPRMLMNRNLLYTAVTRAKKCVTIIGDKEILYQMIQNESEQKRYSTLDKRIIELNKDDKIG